MALLTIYAEGAVRSIEAEKGTRLIDVLTGAGIAVSAPCGGRCFCGKCAVTVQGDAGALHEAERSFLTKEDIEAGKRLACGCTVESDLIVRIEDAQAAILTDGGTAGEMKLDPPVRLVAVRPDMPSLHDQRSDEERFLNQLPNGAKMDLETLRKLPDQMRSGEPLHALLFETEGELRVGGVLTGASASYGVAVDIGTTTLAAYLVNLETGEQLETASALNPQRGFGGDVISRVDHTIAEPEGLCELARLVREQINSMIGEMTQKRGVSPDEIHHITLVGNTIMMHLLLSLTARYIAVLPFIPAYVRTFTLPAREIGLAFDNALATVGPCVAGYIGADTVAAILSSRMDEKDSVSLLIDIGTNGEIALSGKGRILCCSAAAGPAFEGAHIRCGSGAVRGAVDHVRIQDGKIDITTIGMTAPESICGSGLVDAVAGMLKAGILDETGRIDEDEIPEAYEYCLIDIDGKPAVSLTEQGDVYICQKDIREVQLAKSAIAAGVKILMEKLGVTYGEIDALYLAGGFGNFIDRRSACEMGLLPRELLEKIVPIGNGAGAGAKMMLMDKKSLDKVEKLRRRMEYVELSAEGNFQELFAENMMFD